MNVAIFDIDGTLISGTSERLFIRYLVQHRELGVRQLFAFLSFMVRYLPTGGVATPLKNKAYLTGLRVDDVERLAADFVPTTLESHLYTPTTTRLAQHQRRGDVVVLVSGTLLPIAHALGARLGVMHVCATLVSERDGIILAQPPTVHPYGTAKLSLVRQIAASLGVDLGRFTAYGDSIHDVPLLEAVGEAVAVRPDHRLLATALARGWEIMMDPSVERTANP